MANNPKVLRGINGEFLALGGGGELHVNPDRRPDACWMPNSGRVLVHQSAEGDA